MKATTFLARQHHDLRQLCDAVESGSPKMRESLMPQLAGDLVAHMAVETRVFYPAVARLLRDRRWLHERKAANRRTRKALDRALTALGDDKGTPAFEELRALVHRHADEEEEALFARVDREIDVVATRDLTLAMMALYHVKVELGYSRRHAVPTFGACEAAFR